MLYDQTLSKNRNDALSHCQTLWNGEGSLLMIYSMLDFNNFIPWCKKMSNCQERWLYLRLYHKSGTKDLGTLDGSPVSYLRWVDNFPRGNGEDCIITKVNGALYKYIDYACSPLRPTSCQSTYSFFSLLRTCYGNLFTYLHTPSVCACASSVE